MNAIKRQAPFGLLLAACAGGEEDDSGMDSVADLMVELGLEGVSNLGPIGKMFSLIANGLLAPLFY